MNLSELSTQIRECSRCELREGATQPVPGCGSPNATYFILGEAPGKEEDKRGVPFIGAAGKRLDKLLSLANIDPNDCYLTNAVKCRPPENRDPRKKELRTCYHWLQEELRIVKPQYIISLGRVPLSLFTAEGLRTLHGTMLPIDIDLGEEGTL